MFSLGVGSHQSVFDAVVDHLDEMAGQRDHSEGTFSAVPGTLSRPAVRFTFGRPGEEF